MYSILICTYNKVESLKAVLANLEFLETRNVEFEVQIVVDGSTDETLEYLKTLYPYYPLMYHYIENSGLTAARNYGIEKCNGKYVIFCDDDVIFHPLFLINLDAAVRVNPDKIHIGNLVNIDKKFSPFIIQGLLSNAQPNYTEFDKLRAHHIFFEGIKSLYAFRQRYTEFKPSVWWAVVTGGNLCIPKKHFKNIGFFDTNITGWGPEDADLCYRFFRSGVEADYNENCYLYHLDHERDSEKIMRSMTRNAVYFVKKYSKPLELYTYLMFTNAKVSLKEFNDQCSEIFNYPKIDVPEFYLSMKDYSSKRHVLK
ncbi:glycosyltransferase family 2 protein [Muricauda sp. MAR_2010_75]|uniref:glycosyltransferase family 2 protein n=1 Tax=Allomuricauda sp. MAR_2010_75 TaxID=1250232 RepID=UPI00055DC925|nr:glycosyltransferase [Muricauda sp. MAR_2010_75]